MNGRGKLMSEVSKSEEKRMTETQSEAKKPFNSPKTPKATWDKVRLEFEAGSYLSLSQLAKKYGIHPKTLESRYRTEGWKQQREAFLSKASEKIEAKVVKELSQADSYLQNSFKRALRLEKIADASLSQASLTNEGIPLVDLEQVDILTRSELRIHELARSALRIPAVSQLDVTTGGKDLGSSFVQAIAKLRQSQDSPKLEDSDVSKILDAGVE